MLKKGAIHQVQTIQGEFLSNIFLVSKKYAVKVDIKDAYFGILLHKDTRKFIEFGGKEI